MGQKPCCAQPSCYCTAYHTAPVPASEIQHRHHPRATRSSPGSSSFRAPVLSIRFTRSPRPLCRAAPSWSAAAASPARAALKLLWLLSYLAETKVPKPPRAQRWRGGRQQAVALQPPALCPTCCASPRSWFVVEESTSEAGKSILLLWELSSRAAGGRCAGAPESKVLNSLHGGLFSLLSETKSLKHFEIFNYFHLLITKHLNQFLQKLPLAGFDLISNSINPPLLAFSNISQRLFGVF